jgi:hypothetical protein
MQEAKDTRRALVHIGLRWAGAQDLSAVIWPANASKTKSVCCAIWRRAAANLSPVLEADPENLKMITTNCGSRVDHMARTAMKELFAELEQYGVRHDDPFLRNITYRFSDGRFCVIDFEFRHPAGRPAVPSTLPPDAH